MTKQKKWSDMDTETRAHARDMMRRFEQSVCSEATSARARRGILKMRDPFGAPRRLHLHQVVAAQRLLLKHRETPWEQRKSALLAIHDLGLGKTITAVLAIAKVLNKCPDPDAAKVVVLCPLAVLSAWDDALRTWTTLGDRVLVGHRQAAADRGGDRGRAGGADDARRARWRPSRRSCTRARAREDRKKPKMQRFHHGVAPSDATRREQLQGALPPDAPDVRAAHAARAARSALTVVDELHRCCNPTTMTGHVVAMFCADSVYTLGLTGTPVTSQPSQMAHLAKALNAQPRVAAAAAHFFWSRRATRAAQEAAVAEYHAAPRGPRRRRASWTCRPRGRCCWSTTRAWAAGPTARGRAGDRERTTSVLASAQQVVVAAAATGGPLAAAPRRLPPRAARSGARRERAAFAAIVALGNYEFSAVLGAHGAAAFKGDPSLFAKAAAAERERCGSSLRVLRRAAGGGARADRGVLASRPRSCRSCSGTSRGRTWARSSCTTGG